MSKKNKKILSLFKSGGGDDEKTESERAKRNLEKRKLQQKSYDKVKRKRTVKESWLDEYTWLRLDLHSRINPGGVGKKSFRLIYTFSPERGPEYARVNFIGGSIRNTSTSRQRAFQK